MSSLDKQEVIKVGAGFKGSHFILGAILLLGFLGFSFVRQTGLFFINKLQNIDFFHVSQIEVSSEWPLEVTKIREWVNPLKGKNIFLIDSKEVAESLQQRPWIEAVSVKKIYPSSLLISLSAKKPFALVMKEGKPWFIDPQGVLIERVTPGFLKGVELPFLSFENKQEGHWDVAQILRQYEKMKEKAEGKIVVSQIVLGSYPYFKTYLSQPRWEVWWSLENWEEQMKNLISLVVNPPSQIGQLKRINLVFPKKAIVSSRISN